MFNFLVGAFDFAYIFKTITTKWYYYVGAVLFVLLIVGLFFIKRPNKRNNLSKTQKICYTAILTALSVIVNVFDIKISDELQISLLSTVCFIAGYLLGFGLGFTVGFLGDLLGAIINPHGPYNPVIGIGSGMWGLVFGIAFSYFKGNKYLKTVFSFLICFVLISCGINILGFCLMYPTRYTLQALLPTIPIKLLVVVINCIICCFFVTILPKILDKNKFDLK